jgi:hypothetical protein
VESIWVMPLLFCWLILLKISLAMFFPNSIDNFLGPFCDYVNPSL